MEVKTLTCIRCPMGCNLKVTLDKNEVIEVTGNTCKRGEVYAGEEVINPVRTVTSTVRVREGDILQVSCKTSKDIPKDKIFDIMRALKGVSVNAPVMMGDIIIENAANIGVNIIATKEVNRKKSF